MKKILFIFIIFVIIVICVFYVKVGNTITIAITPKEPLKTLTKKQN